MMGRVYDELGKPANVRKIASMVLVLGAGAIGGSGYLLKEYLLTQIQLSNQSKQALLDDAGKLVEENRKLVEHKQAAEAAKAVAREDLHRCERAYAGTRASYEGAWCLHKPDVDKLYGYEPIECARV